MNKKLLLAVVVAALVVGLAMAVKHKREAVAARTAAQIPPVVVDARELVAGAVVLTLPVSVDVQAVRDTVLASRYAAYVTELTRFEGDHFKRGEVLARLDMSQAEADLTRAEAQLAQSRLQEGTVAADLAAAKSLVQSEEDRLARLDALYKIGGVSLEQVQAGESSLAAARARLSAAQASAGSYHALYKASEAQARAAHENLHYGVIIAPFDGVVSQRLAQPGDLAAPGKPLLKVIDSAAGSRLLVSVPQTLHPSALVVNGERLKLTAWPEAVGQGMSRFEARSRASLLPGTKVDAALEVYRSESGIVVPRACLLGDDGHNAQLLRLDGGKVRAVSAAIAAAGEEGVALVDNSLGSVNVVCASPDILARVQAGAPVRWREIPKPHGRAAVLTGQTPPQI